MDTKRRCARQRRWKRVLSLLPGLAFVVFPPPSYTDKLSLIQAITATPERVEIRLSAPAAFQQASILKGSQSEQQNRCYIDVSPAILGNQVPPIIDVNAGLVQRVRVGQFRPHTARVVLDLFSAPLCQVRSLTEPDRLMITVGPVVRSNREGTEPSITQHSPSRSRATPTADVRLAAASTESRGTSGQRRSRDNQLQQSEATAAQDGDEGLPGNRSATGKPVPGEKSEEFTGQVITLEEAYRLALANEEQIKIAERELVKARLLPWRALSLLTPRGDITGTWVRNKQEISFIGQGDPAETGGTVSTIRPLETWQGIFSVTQPLIQPSFLPSWRLGKSTVQQNEQQYDFTTREVLFGVARAYYDVLRARAQVTVAHDTLRLAQDELKQAQARFRVGEVTKTDVLRAEVAVARAERALTDTRNNLQLALSILARAIGVREPLRIVEPAPVVYSGGGYEQLLDQAYAQRQDLRAQILAIEIVRQRKHQVVARYFPQVGAQWQFPRLNPETFANRDEFWTLLLTFQVPIFDGGVREIDLQEQNENLIQAQLQVDRLRKDIGVEVKTALLEVETLETNLETLKKEVALAQENYDITSKQYGVGLATSLDVNTSLNALNQVRTQLIDQTYAYQIALLGIERAVGSFAQEYLPQR